MVKLSFRGVLPPAAAGTYNTAQVFLVDNGTNAGFSASNAVEVTLEQVGFERGASHLNRGRAAFWLFILIAFAVTKVTSNRMESTLFV